MDDHPIENGVVDTESDDNGLIFDVVHHGRNIKLEDEGKAAQKIKK